MITRTYAFGQRHWLAFLNIAIGMLNISNALDPVSFIPAPVFALIGSGCLLIGGWSLGWRVQMDKNDREFFELCQITHALLDQASNLALERLETKLEQKPNRLQTQTEPNRHVD